MNINFNVTDELGNQFITASRWMIDRPDLTDDRIIKKNIKRYIGDCIDNYNRSLLLNESASLVTTLESQLVSTRNQLVVAQEDYLKAKGDIDSIYTSVDVGPD